MPDIQVAIQGGGAKIWALLASVHALQELESEGVLKVSRIAGTSAGAIAGCIFAAGIDLAVVRQMLRAEYGEQLVRFFPSPKRRHVLWLLMLGKPLWKERRLGDELRQLFQGKNINFLDELRVPTFIIATNLNTQAKVVHQGHVSVVQALLDSAGIPFCFRTWKHSGGSVVVDGGLCENLPSEELTSGEKAYGPVAGISFQPAWSGPPENVKEFSVALLDAAINNSVERAKQRLGQEAVFSVNAKVGTFQFGDALKKLDDSYELVKRDAKDFFKKFASRRPRIVGNPWSIQNLQFMKKLAEVYRAQHGTPLKYERCKLLVRANSLLENPGPDFVQYSVRFRTVEEAVYCHRIALSESGGQDAMSSEAEWDVFGPDDSRLETIYFPIVDPETSMGRELLLFFKRPLGPNSGPYTILLRDNVVGLTASLPGRKDELAWSTKRAQGPVGRVDLVIQVPKRFHATELRGHIGAPIPLDELAAEGTSGFLSFGWRGEHLDPIANDGQFAADLFVK